MCSDFFEVTLEIKAKMHLPNLKLVSAIFIKLLFFSPNDSSSKTIKHTYFIKKALFVLELIKFPSFPLLFLVSHCFRGWSKINLKVYDPIMCLNKNSITHFVWYLETEKRYETETLSIDGVSNKEHFIGKIMQKVCTKS